MIKTTVRDALRDAMAEEMRADDRVFLMGEEVAQYQGAYKVSRDLLQEFGDQRVIDTPITEHGFAGFGVGGSHGGFAAYRRVPATFNFAMQAIDQISPLLPRHDICPAARSACLSCSAVPNRRAAWVAAQSNT